MKFIGEMMAKAKQKLAKRKAKPAPVAVVAPKPAAVEAPKPEPISIQINAKYLRAMRHVAAQQDIRYYLNGVYFQATKEGGKFYVATDGHRIAVIQEPWGSGEEPQDVALIIPRAVAAAAKPFKKASTANLKQVDAWTWTLQGGGDIAQTFKAIDGKFPEWQRVMPDVCSGKVGAYNWSYLHDFNLLSKEAFGRTFSCEVQHNGDGAAIVTSGSNSFLGMVMPMRMSEGTVPQWAIKIQKDNVVRKAQEKLEADARARAATPELAKAA